MVYFYSLLIKSQFRVLGIEILMTQQRQKEAYFLSNGRIKEEQTTKSLKSEEKFSSFLEKIVSIEVVLFLHNLLSQMIYVTSQDLMIQKACSGKFHYNDHFCDDLSTYDAEEAEIQTMISEFLMWRSIFETSLKVVTVPLIGWWSDKWGRKWPLSLCLAFQALYCLSLLYNAVLSSSSLESMLVGSIFYGLSGGTHALLMLSFSYLADRTTTKKRTMRVSILDGFYYLGSPIGMAIASPLFDAGSYEAVFGFGVAIYSLNAVYVLFLFPVGNIERTTTTGKEKFGIEKITNAFYVTFEARPNRARRHILMLIFAMLLDSFVVWGESNVKYLFAQRVLDWDYDKYSSWSSLSSLFSVIGAFAVVPLLNCWCPLHDAIIGIIGGLSRTFSRLCYAFAISPSASWLMYAGALIGTCSTLAPIAIRAQLSKLAPDDFGQVYAVMAVGETFLPFISAPVYTNLYEASIDTYPGSFYLLSTIINATLTLFFLIVYLSMRRTEKK